MDKKVQWSRREGEGVSCGAQHSVRLGRMGLGTKRKRWGGKDHCQEEAPAESALVLGWGFSHCSVNTITWDAFKIQIPSPHSRALRP